MHRVIDRLESTVFRSLLSTPITPHWKVLRTELKIAPFCSPSVAFSDAIKLKISFQPMTIDYIYRGGPSLSFILNNMTPQHWGGGGGSKHLKNAMNYIAGTPTFWPKTVLQLYRL